MVNTALSGPVLNRHLLTLLLWHDAQEPTTAQREKLDTWSKQTLDNAVENAQRRAKAARDWMQMLEKKEKLPRDLTRLIWEIMGEWSEYIPGGANDN